MYNWIPWHKAEVMCTQKWQFPPEPKGWHQKNCSEGISSWRAEGRRRKSEKWESWSCCLLTGSRAQPCGEKAGHALMKHSGGYSCKFPPSQNPACTLFIGALPKPRLLGITASPSFAAESNKSTFWLLDWFPEFGDFFTQVLLFIRKFSQGLFPSLLFGSRI